MSIEKQNPDCLRCALGDGSADLTFGESRDDCTPTVNESIKGNDPAGDSRERPVGVTEQPTHRLLTNLFAERRE